MSLFASLFPKRRPPVFMFSPEDLGYEVGSSTSVFEIRRRLGEPNDKWDDEVECSLRYNTSFGIIEFLCESAISKGPEKALLKYIEIEAERTPNRITGTNHGQR